jgi:hypothetical protein
MQVEPLLHHTVAFQQNAHVCVRINRTQCFGNRTFPFSDETDPDSETFSSVPYTGTWATFQCSRTAKCKIANSELFGRIFISATYARIGENYLNFLHLVFEENEYLSALFL